MAHVEPGDAHDEMREETRRLLTPGEWQGRKCSCPHPDRHACYLMRHDYPEDEHPDEQICDCCCHEHGEEDER